MAGTFTRLTFYKLDVSPNAAVEYTGINTWQYRVTNAATGGVNYAGGGNLAMGVSGTATRTISPTGGSALSPTWPTTAGSPVTIYVQEASPGTTNWTTATSSATVLAITNPAVSGTQTFAGTAAATISHTPALSTTGAGGTLEYNATTTTTYSSTGWTTGALTLSRGTSYYLWARRGIGVINENAYSVFNGPFAVPYLATNLAVGTVSPAGLVLTGGNTGNVSVNWTSQANHTYRIIRNDLPSPALVHGSGNGVSTGPISLLFSESVSPTGSPNSGLVDLPNEGVTANYTVEVRRNTVSGGDGLWYEGTGTNEPFEILRILQPTVDDTQDFNSVSPTPISHSIGLKVTGTGGTLEYGWNTTGTNTQASVTNWQNSPTFTNAFTRGNTYYFYARRSTDASDFDVSAAQTVIPLATYGLKIYSNDGSKTIFDPSFYPTNLITCRISTSNATSVEIAPGAFVDITVAGLTSDNDNIVYFVIDGPIDQFGPKFTSVRNAGYVRVTNNYTSSYTFKFFAGRYK